MKNTEMLVQIPFFSGLAEGDLKKIAGITLERRYKKNMIIFMEGEPGDAFYYIKSGKIKVFRTYEDGREHIIHIFSEGDVFGEATLFNDVSYPASASVYEDAAVGVIKNSELEALIKENPDLALKLIKLLCRKLILTQQKIKDLTFKDVFSRTASQIFKLGNDYGKRVSSGLLVDMPLSRQELAEMVGTTRETISRVISKFKKEKSLSEENDRIVIIDEDKLRSWI